MTSPKNPNKYVGPNVYIANIVTRDRIPAFADYRQPETGKNYVIGCLWQVGKNPTSGAEGDLYMLTKIVANQGYWLNISAGGQNVDTFEVDAHTAPGTDPVTPDITGLVTVTGAQVAAGTTANVIRTDSLALNTYTIEVQRSQAVATSTIGDNGVCHFDSASFNVDANAFVTLKGGTEAVDSFVIDYAIAPGTVPVLPNAAGEVTITGAQVAASTIPNVIRSASLAANTITMQIQRSTVAASPTIGNNGVCHFDDGAFGVDANGFVTLKGGTEAIDSVEVDAATAPGTNPVLPTTAGLITVTGAQVAAGTTANVIRTDSLAANNYTIEIQRTQAAASTTIADNGVCHFDSGSFAVDANGFVTLLGGSQAIDSIGVDANTGPGTNPVLPTTGGLVTVTGGQVASGTTANVIRTDSIAANTYTVEIQRSTTAVVSTIASNGVSHFNDADFTVDANGFVSAIGGTAGYSRVNIQTITSTGTYTPTANMKYCVVEVVGGGGGGGGGTTFAGGGSLVGTGGGGGGYSCAAFSAATIGASQAVTIGAGGPGGTGAGAVDGTAGGTTSLGALISVSGGGGGISLASAALNISLSVGTGGTSVIAGSYTVNGSSGGVGFAGQAAFVWIISGTGGSSHLGSTTPSTGVETFAGSNGIAGTLYGSGGSGGTATSDGVTYHGCTGGAGADGVCIITEYI